MQFFNWVTVFYNLHLGALFRCMSNCVCACSCVTVSRQANVPAGGICTGAEVLKTMPERSTYGGFANAQLDPCYHQGCDTLENVDQTVLGQMARSAAFVVQRLAMNPNVRADLGRPRNF